MKKLTITDIKATETLSVEEKKMIVGGYDPIPVQCPNGQSFFTCTYSYFDYDQKELMKLGDDVCARDASDAEGKTIFASYMGRKEFRGLYCERM